MHTQILKKMEHNKLINPPNKSQTRSITPLINMYNKLIKNMQQNNTLKSPYKHLRSRIPRVPRKPEVKTEVVEKV